MIDNRKEGLKGRKAQNEMVGFVLIVVIITIVAVIFLTISLGREPSGSVSDIEINSFLSSSSRYTSDCVISEPLYADVRDLLDDCYDGKICSDGRDSCIVLTGIYGDMLNNVFPVGDDRPVKYRNMVVYFQLDSNEPTSKQDPLINIKEGNKSLCSERRAGDYKRQKSSGGDIVVELEVCGS
jgi:hypothetical protein